MKVLCRKDYIVAKDCKDSNYYKDKLYEVFIEYDDSYWLHSLTPHMVNKFKKEASRKNKETSSYPVFEDYFLTVSESRKIKINKLNELQ